MFDLHFHSHYSDGIFSPRELAKEAKKLGFKTVALTDHNCLAGIEKMNIACAKLDIKNIPGVEIYTHYKNFHLHILGYQIDFHNKKLNAVLNKLQQDKIPIIKQCLEILKQDGWQIDERKVFAPPAVYLGVDRPAKALMDDPKNLIRIKKELNWGPDDVLWLSEVVCQYFFKDHQLICPETEIDAREAIDLIHQAGGQAVLAHPGQQLSWQDDQIIAELKEGGLDGLEAISSHHNWAGMEYWQLVSRKLKLLATIGSDFHGYVPDDWGLAVRGPWDYFKITNKKLIKTNIKRILDK